MKREKESGFLFPLTIPVEGRENPWAFTEPAPLGRVLPVALERFQSDTFIFETAFGVRKRFGWRSAGDRGLDVYIFHNDASVPVFLLRRRMGLWVPEATIHTDEWENQPVLKIKGISGVSGRGIRAQVTDETGTVIGHIYKGSVIEKVRWRIEDASGEVVLGLCGRKHFWEGRDSTERQDSLFSFVRPGETETCGHVFAGVNWGNWGQVGMELVRERTVGMDRRLFLALFLGRY